MKATKKTENNQKLYKKRIVSNNNLLDKGNITSDKIKPIKKNVIKKEGVNKKVNKVQKKIEKVSLNNEMNKTLQNEPTKNAYKKILNVKLPKKLEEPSTPGIIGLTNIGAICYMNATLQCFSNCPRLNFKLLALNEDLKKNKNTTQKLTFNLSEVFRNLWKKLNHKNYTPRKFKEVINQMNPTLNENSPNDPKDLILFLLETMHKELNTAESNNDFELTPNFNDFMSVYGASVYNFESKNKSIIFDEFYFYYNSMITCANCNYLTHNLQMNYTLLFPLEEVKKFKEKNDNSVMITDCFEYFERQATSPSTNCSKCKTNCNSYNQSKLVKGPKTLIINFNHENRDLENGIKIIFEEYLNLRKYIFNQDSPYYYELTGVICNDSENHFIAFCKNYNDCNWYKYNDNEVKLCNFEDVCSIGLIYSLFYSYVHVYQG